MFSGARVIPAEEVHANTFSLAATLNIWAFNVCFYIILKQVPTYSIVQEQAAAVLLAVRKLHMTSHQHR